MKYYLIVGEASGDLHASNLIRSIRQLDTSATFRFYGGDMMLAAADDSGVLVRHYKELAYMGFIPVLMHLRTIMRNMSACKRDIQQWQPDALILVDYPGFNLDIAKTIHKKTSIPIFYYISPKIWAWKEYRIKNIKRDIDKMLCILPFEVDFYQGHDYPVSYVGNPCVDAIHDFLDSPEGQEDFDHFARANHLGGKPVIALLAGSRRQEVKDNLRPMIEAAQAFPDYQLVVAGAPSLDAGFYRQYIPEGADVSLVFGQTYRLLRQATAAFVTSGTATLETALLRVPQVVCYHTPIPKVVAFIKRRVLHVQYVSLVNLIARREVVQELVADRMTPDEMRRWLGDILPGHDGRERMLADYDEMARTLGGPGASGRAAQQIIQTLQHT